MTARILALVATIPPRRASCERLLGELAAQSRPPDGVILCLDGYGDAPAPACPLPVIASYRTHAQSGPGHRWGVLVRAQKARWRPSDGARLSDDIVISIDDDPVLSEAPRFVEALAETVEACGGAAAGGAQTCQRDGTFGACVCPDAGAPGPADAPAVTDDGPGRPDVAQPRDSAPEGPADASADAPGGRAFNDPPAPSCYGSCTTHQECFAACFVQGDSPRFCCYRGRCVATESACTDVPALVPARVCGRATCERDDQCQCGAPGERWRCMSRAPLVGSCTRAL